MSVARTGGGSPAPSEPEETAGAPDPREGRPEAHIGGFILKVVSPCNLNCSYCYIYNHEDQLWRQRPKFISEETYLKVLGRMREYADGHDRGVSLTYHGGEPCLVGVERMRSMVHQAREHLGGRLRCLTIQTNGTLIDEAWADLVLEEKLNLGISLDGPPDVNDTARVYHDGRGSHADAVRGLRILQDKGYAPYVLSVVNVGHSGRRCYDHFRSLGVRRFDFLLPDVSWDNKEKFYGGHGPTPVADFYLGVIDAWLDEDDPTIEVRTPFGLFSRLMGGNSWGSDVFGNPPMGYIIVERRTARTRPSTPCGSAPRASPACS